jgi:hypothetical protein
MARSVRGLAAASVRALCAPPPVQATPLTPGGSVSGTSPGNVVPSFSGTVVAVTPFQDSSFFFSGPNGPVVGFVSSAVVKSTGSGLDFVYQVNVSAGTVTGLSIDSFHNTVTDVVQTANRSALASTNQFFTGNVPASTYTRSDATGDTISLTFSTPTVAGVTAEEASYLVIVQTNSPTYTPSTASVSINSSGSIVVDSLAPVPEPSTLALWGGTLGAFGCCIAWRRSRLGPAIA